MHSEHKFPLKLWDDSDPSYSPCLMWVKGKYPYWRRYAGMLRALLEKAWPLWIWKIVTYG